MKSLLDFTNHAKTMMHERLIQEDWVINTVNNPDMIEGKKGGRKTLPEADSTNRWKISAGYRQSICFSSTGNHDIL